MIFSSFQGMRRKEEKSRSREEAGLKRLSGKYHNTVLKFDYAF